jgi:hypothetical protein
MLGFSYTSQKHRRDQTLLTKLSDAIFVLKLHAQGELLNNSLQEKDVQDKREEIIQFLQKLEQRVLLLIGELVSDDVEMAFTGLADRFRKYNSADVQDRVAELERLRKRLSSATELRERDFQILDGIQSLLESETAEGVRNLYRL